MCYQRKLVFYSDTETPSNLAIDERLLHLIGRPRPRIGYVAATVDNARIYFDVQRERYRCMGADLMVYVDADTVHDGESEAALLACDAIHLSGGNTFEFLHWLKRSSLMQRLPRYVADGGVLIGVSAGAILMTPSAACAGLCGDQRTGRVTDDALGLVDFHFWPHYEAGSSLSPERQRLVTTLPRLFLCPDGSGLVVEGNQVECFGAVRQAVECG